MKTINLYELMSLIKRGQAPIKIIWEEETYTYIDNLKDYKRCNGRLLIGNMDLLTNHLEDEIEIIEEDKKLYRIVEFSDIEWYVIDEDNETMTLLMKSRFTKDMMKKYFDERDMDEVFDIKFSRTYNNAWRDSLLRMGLNSTFLRDLEIDKMIEMEITDNNITTKDYVRLLTKDEVDNLPEEILKVNAEYGYWTMSANGSNFAWGVNYDGYVNYGNISNTNFGARAVVKINKLKENKYE